MNTEQMELGVQPQVHIAPIPTVNGLAAEVMIDGLEIHWQVIVLRDGEGCKLYLAHSTPDGWSGLLRQRDYAEFGHPTPASTDELIGWCRWFFRLRQDGKG